MFARQINQCRLDLSLTPRGPLLIRSGRQGADPMRPDLEAVRTTVDGRPSVYIPGSSLKGVARSHAERLLASEEVAITPTFQRGNRFDQKSPGREVFQGTCPLGRTFGTLHVKGRLAVSDLVPGGFAEAGSPERQVELDRANTTEGRNQVAIDRLLGSASGGLLFDQEVVVAGRFDGRIHLRNFQLYQLALVLLVLRDLDQGFVQLGSGTSRGNGWVGVQVRRLVIESRRGKSPLGRLLGAGALTDDAQGYDLFSDDEVALPAGVTTVSKLGWDRLELGAEPVEPLAEALVGGPWARFLDQARGRSDGWAA
jgi:CRISPR/Cas system CSM-associated protein Csm3 (group 7 of RAMP superfamily)